MYTGTNKTAVTSQKSIADALVRLMHAQPYQKISISAICREAAVSRQTFYSLFSSKDQVLDFELKNEHGFDPETTCCCSSEDISLEKLCAGYSSYIIEKQDILELLVENDMISALHASLLSTFSACALFEKNCSAPAAGYAADFLAGGLTGIARDYILQNPRPDEKTLARIIFCLFSGSAFRPD